MDKIYDLDSARDAAELASISSDVAVCVGDPSRDFLAPGPAFDGIAVEVMDWWTLAERLSLGTPPTIVYSAVVSARFDCLDIAQLLYRSGFKGRYHVIAENVPDPLVIRRELAETCPGLDFEVAALPVRAVRRS